MKTHSSDHLLIYDKGEWKEITSQPVNTLQIFITNKCNLKCKQCFYRQRLGGDDMAFSNYKRHIVNHLPKIQKVIILGGEPTMHPDLPKMLFLNNSFGLRTTIYTNGYDLSILEECDLLKTSIRLSVYGIKSVEKSILKLRRSSLNPMIVFMINKDNVSELMETAEIAERGLSCEKFFISSMRDIAKSGSYWKDTEETLPLDEYATAVQDFIDNYKGEMEIHISRRGVLITEESSKITVDKCRFGNIFPNEDKIICPFDICKNIIVSKLQFNSRKCNKHFGCLLRKIVLVRK